MMFLRSLVTALSDRQQEHSFDLDEVHHFIVVEQEMGFDIKLDSEGRGRVFFYIPYSYFVDSELHDTRYLLCQAWRIMEIDPDTTMGRFDLQILSDMEEISIDRHIQTFTHRNYNAEVNVRIRNNMFNIHIVRDDMQENVLPRRQPRHCRRRREP